VVLSAWIAPQALTHPITPRLALPVRQDISAVQVLLIRRYVQLDLIH
jgi:hypothetical protein